MPKLRQKRNKGVRFSETLVFKVTKSTRDRIRDAASRGGATESALVRVLIENGLAHFEACPNRIKPFHTLIFELRV